VKTMTFAALVAASAFMTAPGIAHHSGTMFEPVKEVTLTGDVKEFQNTNPHSWLVVDVPNKDGTVTTWGFEAEGPSTLIRSGIHKSDFKPGTKLTITGHPMRDGRPAAAWLNAVRIEDGKKFDPLVGLFKVN
jgi:hypothetical protein